MRKLIFIGIMTLFLTGCASEEKAPERAQTGHIGGNMAISREMAAKTVALAFYSNEELVKLETELDFSDVAGEEWAYPYIKGCVDQGFFAGSEEGTFRPTDDLTLWEAQALMDRLAPDYDSRIVLTEENKNMAVSYELWVQLLETALEARRGEDSLYSYGIETENAVVLSVDGLCDTGEFTAAGLDLQPYEYSRITFLEKEGEIVALQTVEALSPVVKNIYCRKEEGKLLLETGDGTADFTYKEKIEEGIYDVKLEEGKVAEVVPVETLGKCTVKRVNGGELYLAEQGKMDWAADARVYDAKGEEVNKDDFSGLICGTDTAEYYEKNGEICAAVIRGDAVLENIRVFLKGKEQEKVSLSSEEGFTLSNGKAEKKFPAGAKAALTADLPWFDHGILTVTAESPIRLEFSDGTSYAYEGILELERRGESSFSIINELPVERYLLGVVPHEMPTSFGQTALEAQAITARSYAYNQFYGNTYCGYGAHLTDTTASQVYLGYEKNETAEAAIKATEGMCAVTEEGAVAQTYFYSTSCGFGAGSEEVWSADGNFDGEGKSYLQSQSYGDFTTPQTEEEWLAFWQDWEQEGYDMDSPWYRWKVYFGCGQLTEILQKTLVTSSNCTVEGNRSDLGKLQGMAVTRRGTGGIAMELELTFEKGTATVKTENAIRKVLSPTKLTIGEPIYLQRKGGDSITGNTMLPSGFFAVKEMRNSEGTLTGIALYGGGNGHGVGMSQYGAKHLAETGKTAEEIIEYYFTGTTVDRVL
ncbi:SpoIID/LytB domain-containing protein [Anaerotignum sp.]|nr:SpoIID/LytB domain-containing protein [Anaerotignum sp.]MBQ7758955.1 SpoIID/LytB domain-containing protein [Anaerotignum sp.]